MVVITDRDENCPKALSVLKCNQREDTELGLPHYLKYALQTQWTFRKIKNSVAYIIRISSKTTKILKWNGGGNKYSHVLKNKLVNEMIFLWKFWMEETFSLT